MSVHTKSAVISSLAIHVIFIGGLLLFVLLGLCSEKPQRHVFELISLPDDNFVPQLPPQIEQLDDLPLTIPEIVEVPTPPVIPDIAPPPPPPSPAPAKVAPTPAPSPRPTPQPPAPKVVTMDQFVQEHGRPRDPTPRQTPQRPAPKAPQIDLSQIRKGLERVAQPTTTAPTRQELEAMAAFERTLTRQIDLAWIKPPEASARGLVAVVSFVVQADGRITDARIARSSGNSSFDNSALQAVRSARGFGTPPNRLANTYTIPFRLDER